MKKFQKTRILLVTILSLVFLNLYSGEEKVVDRNFKIPDLSALMEWTNKETKLGNPALEKYARQVKNPDIDKVLAWSKTVNKEIGEWLHGLVPFPYIRESLMKMEKRADIMVVSQTPLEALCREWKDNNLEKYVRFIAGQEYGTKAEHLALAAKGKYPEHRILMIGDAPGDLKAARKNGVLFFPVNPGNETASWKRFHEEALDKFLSEEYTGDYENALITEFNRYLPERPPWEEVNNV